VASGASLLAAALFGCSDPPGLAARFDYSMPARFAVPDPIVPDGEYEVYVDGELHPESWLVRLDACKSTGRVVRYAWSVDGASIGESAVCGPFDYAFPDEGRYSVSLLVEDDGGDVRETTKDVVVRDYLIFGVGDSYGSGEGSPDVDLSLDAIASLDAARARVDETAAAIAALEDAVSAAHAGDAGAPAAELAVLTAEHERAQADLATARAITAAQWQNERCHRSAFSGQVLAAEMLEASDPHSSVTFVHLACSGARMYRGLLGEYAGVIEPEPGDDPFPPQIERVAELADGHAIDALVISIGGNDVNFANVVEACVVGERCFDAPVSVDSDLLSVVDALCPLVGAFETDCEEYFDSLLPDPASLDAKALFDTHSPTEDVEGVDQRQDGNDDLPDGYRDLADAIVSDLGMDPSRVHLTEYPDITRNQSGFTCGWDTAPLQQALVNQLPGMSQEEFAWASSYVLGGLKTTMQTSATEHGWRLVDGVSARFERHGYCAGEPWVVRIQNSFYSQGDSYGIVHPNRLGYQAYAEEIVDAISSGP